ncbi:MAG: dTDP-glucose 4,6-dehydratase [Anaerolineales bacterium]|nr:dTDP-glucose 4,6-dehydratase [Anaerolineales bacterium]
MKNVLITGGAGFIGSNFIRYLLKAEPDVQIINIDALTYAGSLANLEHLPDNTRHTFIQGDICDSVFVERIVEQYQVDTIVHFAAESHVDRSIAGPTPFIQTNIVGTFTLLQAAYNAWGKSENKNDFRFHHISTDEVFGSLLPDSPAFTEITPYDPRSPYSASKAASDHLVRAYYHTYGLPVTITNCSNNYGPYQFPEKLIPLIILNALQGKHLPVYGDGKQVRDWLYVEDHCDAIHLVLKKGKLGETYNIGGENQPTNIEIVNMICAILDELKPASLPYASLIQYVSDRPGHDRRYAMNIEKIKQELNWSPKHTLANGLRETVEWYLLNIDWVNLIMSQNNYQNWLNKKYQNQEEIK